MKNFIINYTLIYYKYENFYNYFNLVILQMLEMKKIIILKNNNFII
jgi:hypothetical protein